MGNTIAATSESAVTRPAATATGKRYFVRLNYAERVQHLTLVACFVVLAVTGFMLKIPEELIKPLGGAGETIFYYRSFLHRTAGTVLILLSLYHVTYLLFTPPGRRWLMDMLPGLKDLKDMRDNFLYFAAIKSDPPEFDRFSYKQKMEYGAMLMGNTLMAVSGLLLWTEYLWNKFWVDIATVVHGMEAILACLAVIIWHLYEIHFRPHKHPLNNMWLTGLMDEEELKEDHALHYKKIMRDSELQKIYMSKEDP